MTKPFLAAFSIALLGLCLAAAVRAADEPPAKPADKSLAATYHDLADMLRKNDVAALRATLADDFVLIDHEGKTNPKAGLLKAMTDGVITFRSFDYGQPSTKDLGDAAVLQGPTQMAVTYGRATPTDITGRFAVTTVFVKQDGHWRLTAAHLTATKPRQAP